MRNGRGGEFGGARDGCSLRLTCPAAKPASSSIRDEVHHFYVLLTKDICFSISTRPNLSEHKDGQSQSQATLVTL